MSVRSLKFIKSLDRLPTEFRQANASFLRFKQYQSKDRLVSYFSGLYTVQILIDLITTKDSITGLPLVNDSKDITVHLVTVLENERVKLSEDEHLKAILESHQKSREYLLDFVNKKFENSTSFIETGQASGKTVTELLDCASLYEITRGLFPYESLDDVDAEMEVVGENKNKGYKDEKEEENKDEDNDGNQRTDEKEEAHEEEKSIDEGNDKELLKLEDKLKSDGGDLATDLADLTKSTEEDANLEDHISQSIKDLTTNPKELSKEDEVINAIINKNLSYITDEEIEERISYCRKHAQRIVTAVKKGENPQISSNSIDSRPITSEEIEKTIKDALNEPDEEEDDGEIAFPQLPTTLPGQNNSKAEPESEVIEPENEDEEEEEKEVDLPSPPKITPKLQHKQLGKEDIEGVLEDSEILEKASKSAKFAISAINYEDIDTAISQLTKSIELLNEYKDRHD